MTPPSFPHSHHHRSLFRSRSSRVPCNPHYFYAPFYALLPTISSSTPLHLPARWCRLRQLFSTLPWRLAACSCPPHLFPLIHSSLSIACLRSPTFSVHCFCVNLFCSLLFIPLFFTFFLSIQVFCGLMLQLQGENTFLDVLVATVTCQLVLPFFSPFSLIIHLNKLS